MSTAFVSTSILALASVLRFAFVGSPQAPGAGIGAVVAGMVADGGSAGLTGSAQAETVIRLKLMVKAVKRGRLMTVGTHLSFVRLD